ncbi:hypothetical protein CN918_25855 [Priestia megaterium]|nr:hypothetical protein CN918_25855 [Priestia megaterium]
MKIDYASDLHLNHWMLWTENQRKWEMRTRELMRHLVRDGNGEVLILPGDFSEWNIQTFWALEEAAKYYERVYVTYGNHDLYLMSKKQTLKYGDSLGRLNELKEMIKDIPNVVFLNQIIDTFKGVTFAGDTMWYLPKKEEDWSFYRNVSHDSDSIQISGLQMNDVPRKLWKESMDWYDTLEGQHIDVFVSHVPPLHPPTSVYPANGCFHVDVPFLAAPHWICGHNHLKTVFDKAGTTFYMNCLGYAKDYKNYKPNTVPDEQVKFKIQTFSI